MSSPFHYRDPNAPDARKLEQVWTLVEREARGSDLGVQIRVTTPEPEWFYPAYCPFGLELVIRHGDLDTMRAELLQGMGLHLHRRLFVPGDENSLHLWTSAARRWAQAHEARLSLEFDGGRAVRGLPSPPPSPPVPLRCSAIKRDRKPCRATRIKGTAFCYFHQHHAERLSTFADIEADIAARTEGGSHAED